MKKLSTSSAPRRLKKVPEANGSLTVEQRRFLPLIDDLRTRRLQILQSIGIAQESAAGFGAGGDSADLALQATACDTNAAIVGKETKDIKAIDYAVERFQRGVFGICEACDRGIPFGRLKAEPASPYCVQCKTSTEQHGEMNVFAKSSPRNGFRDPPYAFPEDEVDPSETLRSIGERK